MKVQRTVSVVEDEESCIGAWEIICGTCPLLPHLEALNQKPRACIAGMSTNMQGAIRLNQCEFYQHDSLDGDRAKGLTIHCNQGGK